MMGEYFLDFQQITRGDSSVDMNDLDQMILPLTKPQEQGKRDKSYFVYLVSSSE